jgi:hypothetical protein
MALFYECGEWCLRNLVPDSADIDREVCFRQLSSRSRSAQEFR